MLGQNRVSAVLVSTDLAASERFYQDRAGLTLSPKTIKNHLVFECGDGTTLLSYGRGKKIMAQSIPILNKIFLESQNAENHEPR